MPEAAARPRVAIITLGCPKNEVDSDLMASSLQSADYPVIEDIDEADVVIVNTCSFIQDATEESIATVLSAARDWLPESPGRRLIVAGCMPSRYGDDLATALPEVDAVVTIAGQRDIVDVVAGLTGVDPLQDPARDYRHSVGHSAYLRISDGCHRNCSYCTIPAIRGGYRSRSLSDIVAEADELIGKGAREIVLIGQDISAYGRDLPGQETLADVVRAVSERDGIRWLRLMYVQPEGVTDELLRVMASSDVVCDYLDMPLQHASARVLRAMHRSGDADSFLSLIARIRSFLPGVTLRTTLIAGFPGETRADMNELQRFLSRADFDYVGVFPYSPEDGTVAATLPDQVPLRTRRARAQRLRDQADVMGHRKVEALVDRELEVIVEGIDPDDGVVFGRWRGQAPEIDGVVLLDKGTTGDIVRVRVIDTLGYDLEGEVV